jgi:hypothetical protein
MRTWIFFCLMATGCADGTSVLTVSVSSAGTVTGIDHLVLRLTDVAAQRVSQAITATFDDKPVTLPPARAVSLVLPANLRGEVKVSIDAVDARGVRLATTEVSATVSPGQLVSADALLPGGTVPDMSEPPDMSLQSPDMTCQVCPTVCCPTGQQCGSTGCCTPGSADAPDSTFDDSNCDGVDGDAADSVFVDPVNGSDTGNGTRLQPLKRLSGAMGAIALAVSQMKRNILVSTGTVSETVTVALPSGISLWGGYDAAQSWKRSDTIARPNVTVAAPTAVQVLAPTMPIRWDRLDITAGNATAAGGSSYGLFSQGGTSMLTVSNSVISAGNGATGSSSQAPAKASTPTAANGAVGSGNYTAVCCMSVVSNTCMPGAPGTNSCAFTGGVGSACGSGTSVAPAMGPNPGGPGGLNTGGGAGGMGGGGANAATPTLAFGTLAAAGYTPANGTVGGAGSGGSGGGGGGLPYGGSCSCGTTITIGPGHGGGAGGCGGGAAGAAGGGGGSFAVYLFGGSPLLENLRLIAGRGGNGGAGSLGGLGSDGGTGGGQGTTVPGGAGGPGGRGGTSSGGPGGPAICLEIAGGATPTLVATPTFVSGTAGSGGTSPVPAINGVTGIVANQRTN